MTSTFTHQELLGALKGLSSQALLTLNDEIEAIALERIEEEEIVRVRERERQKVIDDFKVMLSVEGITPEELVAFSISSIVASKRHK
ncbi:hypothetical protein [Aeromonas veronii]|uniref:H-NS family histone-like protein n=1 Tax=Aeromonas veronii TaxID=654 RepID=UPI002F3E6974